MTDSQEKAQTEALEFAIDETVDGNSIQQLAHDNGEPQIPIDYRVEIDATIKSWEQAFYYKQENAKSGIGGLREPQLGAVHSAHAHWAISNEAATIVMPTGVGKTETMLSVLITKSCSRLLVIVPTDVLRTQLSKKFLTLGILKKIGVVSKDARCPIVGVLRHIPKTTQEVERIFSKCQVVVTTMKIVAESEENIQEKIASYCPFLFIDEAHHIAAPTWAKLIERFVGSKILQFTATPFRNDGKPVQGKIIFNYPLRKAQEDGYFRQINFKPVFEFDLESADLVVAEKAVEQLREDRQQGYDHILMARVNSIKRANEVFQIYSEYGEFNPVQIHTGIKSQRELELIRQQIETKQSRIVVCVDMMGEGFDLPELKIAAFHDIKRSLPITLQIAGRFTRARGDLGDATFIANVADVNVRDELKSLYNQDSDWNVLLRHSSETLIQEQIDLWELISGFDELPKEIPLQNVRIAMSTVVYRAACDEWDPENFVKGLPASETFEWIKHDINHLHKVLIVLTAKKTPLPWINHNAFHQLDFDLYVVYWDKSQNLLFINNSNNGGYFKALAEAVCGRTATIINGNQVFRSIAGITRLRLQNVGLKQERGRLVSYTMRAGSDVEPAISAAQRQSASKTNLFGIGFEGGRKTSIGCSRSGRIWARQTCNIDLFIKWCNEVGGKVINETIDPDEVLRGTIVPVCLSARPNKLPIAIEWPEIIVTAPESASAVSIDGEYTYLHEVEIDLLRPSASNKDIEFEIRTTKTTARFALRFVERNDAGDFYIEGLDDKAVFIEHHRQSLPAAQFFYDYPPVVWFVDGSSLTGNEYSELISRNQPYPESKIIRWDWSGTDIRKESQGIEKEIDSIQYRVIQELLKDNYDVVFNDDGPGEAADVVAIKASETNIEVAFYHCKYSSSDRPGRRIGDLYEVCGQAQKSIRWMENITKLFAHLLRRGVRKRGEETLNRYELGSERDLIKFKGMSQITPVQLSVFIVQPGLSTSPSSDQLQLLSVTENHLMETYQLPFWVIANI